MWTTRRTFLTTTALAAPGPSPTVVARAVTEWTFTSGKTYRDPFNDVTLDVVYMGPGGGEHRVPAFWAGGQRALVLDIFSPPRKEYLQAGSGFGLST